MDILKKYKESIMYLVFGVLTVIINISSYVFMTRVLQIEFLISNALSWVVAVIFAYITNKLYVFESKTNTKQELIKEFSSFVSCRVLSGLMEMVLMYIMIDMMFINDFIVKIFTNVLVIVLNYILSKIVIFKVKEVS